MAIVAQDIINKMRQVGLDAEGSDYYRDDIDLIPAINAGIDWLVAVINSALGANKLSEESLRELMFVAVYQTSRYSRVNLEELQDEIWTILSVMPKPTVYQADTLIKDPIVPTYITPSGGESTSLLRTDLAYRESDYSAKRLTIEEWNKNKGNPFSAGNTIIDAESCPDLIEYAYLDPIGYFTSGEIGVSTGREIEIRPLIPNDFVAVSYVKYPNKVADNSDLIELPISLTNLLYQKSLQFVSYKQGDDTTIHNVTANDIQILLNAML
jgi:hypothetical protein